MKVLNHKLFAWKISKEIVDLTDTFSHEVLLGNQADPRVESRTRDIELINTTNINQFVPNGKPMMVTPVSFALRYPLEDMGRNIRPAGQVQGALLTFEKGQPILLINDNRNAFKDQPEMMESLEEQIRAQIQLFMFIKRMVANKVEENQIKELLAEVRKRDLETIRAIDENYIEYMSLRRVETSRKKEMVEFLKKGAEGSIEHLEELKRNIMAHRNYSRYLTSVKSVLDAAKLQNNLARLHFAGHKPLVDEIKAFFDQAITPLVMFQFNL
jgi:hypothetical protein